MLLHVPSRSPWWPMTPPSVTCDWAAAHRCLYQPAVFEGILIFEDRQYCPLTASILNWFCPGWQAWWLLLGPLCPEYLSLLYESACNQRGCLAEGSLHSESSSTGEKSSTREGRGGDVNLPTPALAEDPRGLFRSPSKAKRKSWASASQAPPRGLPRSSLCYSRGS